ncbi:MAG: putative zinc-binding metallopeptidase [Rhodoblastus sp.]
MRRRSSVTIAAARPQTGRSISSVPMRRRIPTRTGRKPSRISSTSSRRWIRRSISASAANLSTPIADPYTTEDFDALIAAFLPITEKVNEINRSMGQPDMYPFVLSEEVVGKLHFIHMIVAARMRVSASSPLVGDHAPSR